MTKDEAFAYIKANMPDEIENNFDMATNHIHTGKDSVIFPFVSKAVRETPEGPKQLVISLIVTDLSEATRDVLDKRIAAVVRTFRAEMPEFASA